MTTKQVNPTTPVTLPNTLFAVDTAGLRKVALRNGWGWFGRELIQNGMDALGVTRVDFMLEPVAGNANQVVVTVVDDSPEGFTRMDYAYTLYAEGTKRDDPTKRGLFVVGEKFAIAVCREATITSTKGCVRFNARGRTTLQRTRESGTEFRAIVDMTHAEQNEVLRAVKAIVPPPGMSITINGETLAHREPVAKFSASLPTTKSDADGVIRRIQRKTNVLLYDVPAGEKAVLYEMGIPVLETGDTFSYNVQQRVPLNQDRDNVPPAYLRTLRVLTMNTVSDQLTPEQATEPWAREATADGRVTKEALRHSLKLRFGDKVVSADPKDAEANNRAIAEGYKVLWGGNLSKDEWAQVKDHGLIEAAGKVFPSPTVDYLPGAEPEIVIEPEQYTPGMTRIARFALDMGRQLLRKSITVTIVNEPKRHGNLAAWYGDDRLTFNLGRLGRDWFERGLTQAVLSLVIHELAHDAESNHLDEAYHDALCNLGARMAQVALDSPHLFDAAPGTPGARVEKEAAAVG